MNIEDIKYNGKVFTCHKIFDFSAMVELLNLLAKKQEYLEKRLNLQEKRINDEKITDLENNINESIEDKDEIIDNDIEKNWDIKSKNEDISIVKASNSNIKSNNEIENKSKIKDNEVIDDKNKEQKVQGNNNIQEVKSEDQIKSEDITKSEGQNKSEDKTKSDDKNKSKDKNLSIPNVKNEIRTTKVIIEKEVNNTNTSDNNDQFYRDILKKIKKIEKKLSNLEEEKIENKKEAEKLIIIEKSNQDKLGEKINILTQNINKINEELKDMSSELSKVKVKAEDFNIYDLFKGDGDGNIDAAKILIMALENKIFKKFGFYDSKFKKDEEDILKYQNQITNLNINMDGIKESWNKIKEEFNELNNKIKNNKTNIEKINNNLEEQEEKNKFIDEYIENNKKLLSNNFKEIDDQIKILTYRVEENKGNSKIDFNKIMITETKAEPENINLLKDLDTRTKELEKTFYIQFKDFDLNKLEERLEKIIKEIDKKAYQRVVHEIQEKIKYIIESDKDLNFKLDGALQFNGKVRGDMQQITKTIEYISGELNRLSYSISERDKGNGQVIDTNKFMEINQFNDKQKENNRKFDQIRKSFEDIARTIDEILNKLSHTPSDNDFSQFQILIKNLIEEFKINSFRKYADKIDTSKSIKFLETQIKSIQETYTKSTASENWLLAKKPINNYICASCENVIKGELNKKSEYIPWNKYPNREEKSYRLGQGFSRMLQMLNEDNINCSDSEQNRNDIKGLKLPKLKYKHLNSGKIKKKIMLTNEEDNNGNSDNNDPYEDNNQGNISDRPKILKIIKRNKANLQSPTHTQNQKVSIEEMLSKSNDKNNES